jgi:hypothetical protein
MHCTVLTMHRTVLPIEGGGMHCTVLTMHRAVLPIEGGGMHCTVLTMHRAVLPIAGGGMPAVPTSVPDSTGALHARCAQARYSRVGVQLVRKLGTVQ